MPQDFIILFMNDHISKLLNFFNQYLNDLSTHKIISEVNKKNINIDYNSKSKQGDVSSNFFLIIQKKILDKNIYICGGGRKNKFLIETIEKKIKSKIKLIDELGIDGDFIESQAFAYLAIRSFLKLPISFPETTGCEKPCTGGIIIKNF